MAQKFPKKQVFPVRASNLEHAVHTYNRTMLVLHKYQVNRTADNCDKINPQLYKLFAIYELTCK